MITKKLSIAANVVGPNKEELGDFIGLLRRFFTYA